MKKRRNPLEKFVISLTFALLVGCATTDDVFIDPNMDFGSLQTIAVLPFQNLTTEEFAAERMRDSFSSMLLATGALYVLPPGEVARGMGTIGRVPREGLSRDQVTKLAGVLEVDAVITGVVSEYGPVRSGAASANVVSVGLQMVERTSGLVVWSASSTKGGVTVWDRLFGGGGEPMNVVTERAVNDLLDKLFQ